MAIVAGDHRAIAEQRLAGEGRDHFGEHAEGRQDQDVDLRMSPGPDQVHEHHHVAAGFVGEEVKAEVAVEQQHRQRRREDGEGGDDQQVGGERRPAEHRHAHIGHAGRANLQDRGDEIDAGQQRADAGNLQRPQVIVDADAGRVGRARTAADTAASRCARTRRSTSEMLTSSAPVAVSQKLTELSVGKATSRTPSCKRHDEVHQPDHERHRDEEDHQRAVRREDLIVVLGRQVARRRGRRAPAASAS